MQKLGELVTSKSKLETRKLVTSSDLTSVQIKTRALGIADGLTSVQFPNDMTAWYCKAYKLLGEAKYAACASMARQPDVRNPKRLFGYLLKEEMSAKG
ncbi:hypothetical protein I8H89_00255 [Candidatus Saccharibacteria bacterium]|nr:hypothetical protein [Candidatus Saccharibacteria bacterium]